MQSHTRRLASLRRRCLFLTCKWNRPEGVWYPAEGGTLYLCVTRERNPSFQDQATKKTTGSGDENARHDQGKTATGRFRFNMAARGEAHCHAM